MKTENDIEQLRNKLHQQITNNGFVKDELLPIEPSIPYYGLNLAFGWPLPISIKASYDKLWIALSKSLKPVSPGLYLYPFDQVNVTVATLVDFKKHKKPEPSEIKRIDKYKKTIIPILNKLFNIIKPKPFEISFHPPILGSKAGFLVMKENSDVISKIRKSLSYILKPSCELNDPEYKSCFNSNKLNDLRSESQNKLNPELLQELIVPNIIHSTILRFSNKPLDHKSFISMFNKIVFDETISSCTIDELLLTSETKPYMEEGEKLFHFNLLHDQERNP